MELKNESVILETATTTTLLLILLFCLGEGRERWNRGQ